jgi:hypothetical protein
MVQIFHDRLKERGAPTTWFLIASDLFRSVPTQIMEASLMSHKWMGAFAFLSAVALIVAMAIGAGPPLLLMVGVLLMVGLLGGLASRRDDRPTEYLYGGTTPKLWTWWTILAAVLGAVYVVMATGQLIADPKGTNVGALGIMMGFAALIALGLRLRSRSKVSGNWMIVFATIPALTFFWIIVPAVVGLAIIAGAVMEISRAAPSTPAAA